MLAGGVRDIRWLLVLPAAVVGAVAAQLALTAPAYDLVTFLSGTGDGWWVAKAAASPFMGAAFVFCAWLVAPDHKSVAVKLSLGAVGVWALWLASSPMGGGSLWPAALGGLGLAGAIGAHLLLARMGRESARS